MAGFIIKTLTFLMPIFVLPGVLDNPFNTPKTLLLLLGAALMTAAYAASFLRHRPVLMLGNITVKLLVILIFLNIINVLYTRNPYYTGVAASLNIACLLFFYFVSVSTHGKQAVWLLALSAISGGMVAAETHAQSANHSVFFPWILKQGDIITSTLGNSNYLGAYLIFPLFALLGLVVWLKGRWRLLLIPCWLFLFGAFLTARARASWLGFFLSLPVFFWLMGRIHQCSLIRQLRTHPRRIAGGIGFFLLVALALWQIAPARFHRTLDWQQIARSETLSWRMEKYYPCSWWLFKQAPLLGTGLWSFRNQVYWAQAKIGKSHPDFFKNYPDPKPRRVHNEYLEVLNDGGLIAAGLLFAFLCCALNHGWRVIDNEQLAQADRVMAGTAFCALLAILIDALFFFAFRVNTILFMTALMLGILEGLYAANYRLIKTVSGVNRPLLIPLVFIALIIGFWYLGVRPFKAESAHFQYKRALQNGKIGQAKAQILKAIAQDPHNTEYLLYGAQLYMNAFPDPAKAEAMLERAIADYNGDITRWTLFIFKGVLAFRCDRIQEAKKAFERALYFNPESRIAKRKLAALRRVMGKIPAPTISPNRRYFLKNTPFTVLAFPPGRFTVPLFERI